MTTKNFTPGSSGGAHFIPPTVDDLNASLSTYEFVEFIGQGGMAAVYKARQPKLDRIVAIKILPSYVDDGGISEAEHSARFKKEALAMAKLNHTNIVTVHDFGATSEGHLYFVMDFIKGTDLHQAIKSGLCTVERVIDWVPQICDALHYAHSEGIIHRDIKPSNILIDEEGVVRVADFGIAKVADDNEMTRLTMANVTMGSPDYLAPESLQDDVEQDHRVDLFALGVMIYQMLTGTVPRGAWHMPSVLNSEADERFDDLVVRAMDPNRETRCQTAIEIGEAIFEIEADFVRGDHDSGGLMIAPRNTVTSAPGSGARSKSGCITSRRWTGSIRTAPLPPSVLKPDGMTQSIAPIQNIPAIDGRSKKPILIVIAVASLGIIGSILYVYFASN
ncbi:MAG: serine/threonine protein kinase [Verrucomicrobiales bacterium]